MTGLAFTKMQGLGNDFVVIDATRSPVELDAGRVRRLADRRLGVGGDQVLLIEPGRNGCDFGYRVFNTDGSEAGHCGNGVRCVARHVRDLGLVDRDTITFATGERRIETHLLADGQVAVNMGRPDFRPSALPFAVAGEAMHYPLTLADGEAIDIGAVSMGNPHAVQRVADIERAPVGTVGPMIERHRLFPHGANAGFMQVVDRGRLRLRVWERGAGETRACGTGACAAVAVARSWGLVDDRVLVGLTGGELVVDWAGADNDLWMTGPAETVYHGQLPG